ncbi:MAG TPA: PLP-dependent aminotransferase family protein, partial [Solirubrobacteraceae bacterium]|nr:PLP-dependent aminotransferase family protein [Solirubrobacteraceae bacterium]
TRVMKSSAMRDLMALTAREDIISFSGGLPDTGTFAPGFFTELMGRVAADSVARALQYGPTEGLSDVREVIATVMAAEGMTADPDAILPTSGGQQALDLVCKILIDPGDVIVAEAPTYPGAVPTFCSYEADVIQVAIDRDGMRIDLLRETLARLDREGRRPKFIYTIPNFHNPAGVTLSLERRRELLRIAGERELLVLEDNPYGLLRYEGEPIPSLFSLDGDFVLYAGTFSKILSPGVRIGWLVAPPPVLRQLVLAKGSADLCSSSVSQYFIAEYFRSGPWLSYVRSLSDLYRRRRDAMLDALAEHFPREASWTHPAGGLFVWATMPDYIDTTDLLARAIEERVAFVPGRAAFVDGRGGSSMRLNFSGVGEEEIREGIRRLGEVISEQVALYSTLTGRDAAPGTGRAASGPGPAGPGPAQGTPEAAPTTGPVDNVRHLPRQRTG